MNSLTKAELNIITTFWIIVFYTINYCTWNHNILHKNINEVFTISTTQYEDIKGIYVFIENYLNYVLNEVSN